MNRVISARNALHSDYIDVNLLRKQHMLEEQERRMGAFNMGGKRAF